jgi:hypothetical protein
MCLLQLQLLNSCLVVLLHLGGWIRRRIRIRSVIAVAASCAIGRVLRGRRLVLVRQCLVALLLLLLLFQVAVVELLGIDLIAGVAAHCLIRFLRC